MRRTIQLLWMLSVLGFLFAAPSPWEKSAAQDDSTVIVGTNVQDVITLDPGRAFEVLNLAVHHAVYETLVTVPPDDLNAFAPGLAERWAISDDGLTYTFYLRSGVTFASGSPLTAEDVRFSWMRVKNLKANPAFYADPIDHIEVVDDLTLRVVLAAPTPAFLSMVTVPAMSVLDSALVREQGGTDAVDADVSDTAQTWLDQNSAGSGPFILTGWVPNTSITLVRNEAYWGIPASIEQVVFRQVNDSTTALQLLERGDIDIVDNLDKDLAERVADDANLRLQEGQSLTIAYLGMAAGEALGGPLADPRVRQAIAFAIDYEGISDGLLLGYSNRPAAMLPVGLQGSDSGLRYERDLERARELLAEAGYEAGFDVTISVNNSGVCGLAPETITSKLQTDLAEIGVELTSEILQSSNFRTAYRAGELPMVLTSAAPDYLDATMWSDFYSFPEIGPAFRLGLNSPTIAELAERGATETDPTVREGVYQAWRQAQVTEAVFIPLCQNQTLFALTDQIRNFVFHPIYMVDFHTLELAST